MKIAVTVLFALCIASAGAQQTDKKLQNLITEAVKGFNGDIGIYVHDLRHNKIAYINADTMFPTASIVKIPILLGVMQKIETGELSYTQRLMYRDSLFYDEGDDILSRFKDSATIELGKVMMLMITISDNCASLWLQLLAGSGTRINEIMDSLGCVATRVNSRTPGREENRRIYGWGQSTPREIAGVMEKIVRGEIYSKSASDKMLRLLSRQYWDKQALSQIPADVFAADKTGALDATRNEVLYVNGRKTPYIFSIFTKNNKDHRWNDDNEAWVMTKKISAILWEYYNGK